MSEEEVTQLQNTFRLDYPSVIGALIYLMNTHPELMFAVPKLAQFMKFPGRKHLEAVLHLLHYLTAHTQLGIRYYHNLANSPLATLLHSACITTTRLLITFSDSSWQECPNIRQSTGCFITFVHGGPVDF